MPITDEILDGVAGYLDTFCGRHSAALVPTSAAGAIEIPQVLVIPTALGNRTSDDTNEFRALTERCLGREDAARQLLFQDTLLAFQKCSATAAIPFFLMGGTALGAVREGYFIPHDDDIDVGIFYSDLEKSSRDGGTYAALQCLLNELTMSRFIVFDVCGTLTCGLEVRCFHMDTQVRLDVNLYYDPIMPDDNSLVANSGPFTWTASYYEDAARRKHAMYRYRHVPFAEALRPVTFCLRDPSRGERFQVPPESYFVEYFGSDWQTPRAYSYREGLDREFKNIIPE